LCMWGNAKPPPWFIVHTELSVSSAISHDHYPILASTLSHFEGAFTSERDSYTLYSGRGHVCDVIMVSWK
jgi:hypothetical protein